ncbi:MAG TPA: hypothetical protein VGS20_06575 [Candidatus Acidoferrales bacterium]|nr:hypothetical protein [Candidatus Acidoferrales bacterium]
MTRIGTLAACIVLLAAAASATSLASMNLRQLTAAAQSVVRARCLSRQSRWEAGEIWTLTRFHVLETFKGAPPAEFTLRVLGGRVGGIESVVAGTPRFLPGDEVVLFLEPSPAGGYGITGWIEGTFPVRRDAQGRAYLMPTRSAAVSGPATGGFRPQPIRPMPLDDFRRQIRGWLRPAGATAPAPAGSGR